MIQFCRLPAQATHAFGRSGTQLRHALSFDQQFSDTFTVVRSMASAEAADSDVESLRGTVRRLSLQVARLKQELGDLHGTDTVALKYIMGLEQCARFLANDSFDTRVHAFRRAYKSLAQHITALQAESIRVEANIKSLQEDLLESSDIAQAVVETGAVVAASFAVTRAIRASPLQNLGSVNSLCSGIWVCGAAFLGLRLIKGICNKAWASGYTNPALKRQLVSDWKSLQERIQIMTALLDWTPSSFLPSPYGAALSTAVQTPSAPPLPAATEPPYQ